MRTAFYGFVESEPAGIAIGMADHNAIRHRDPPLPDRLDPFYPQATIGKWVSLVDPKKIRRRYHHQMKKIRFPPRFLRRQIARSANKSVRINRGSLRFRAESV